MACRMRMKSCKDYVYMATLVGGRALERTHGDIPENMESCYSLFVILKISSPFDIPSLG